MHNVVLVRSNMKCLQRDGCQPTLRHRSSRQTSANGREFAATFRVRTMIAAPTTHLIIADDHPLFRDALRQAVATVLPSAKIGEAGSFEELTALLEQDSDVDLILLDL